MNQKNRHGTRHVLLVLLLATLVSLAPKIAAANDCEVGMGCSESQCSWSVPNGYYCTSCPAGGYLSGDVCYAAPAGSFSLTGSADRCPSGTYQDLAGQYKCNPAEPGHYATGPGATEQTPCATGYYQPNFGQSSCLPADAGYTASGTGNTQETPCPERTHKTAVGPGKCLPDVQPEPPHPRIDINIH